MKCNTIVHENEHRQRIFRYFVIWMKNLLNFTCLTIKFHNCHHASIHPMLTVIESPCSSHSDSLMDDMSNESNDGSSSKNEHRSLDFKLIVDDVKSGQQVIRLMSNKLFKIMKALNQLLARFFTI